MRDADVDIPVLMVSALSDVDERIAAFAPAATTT